MAATLPAGSGGSIFWENISCESLDHADFSTLIAEHPSSPFYVPPLPRPTTSTPPSSSSRLAPPTHINLPPTRRMSIAPDKRISSPSSPKLSGWNFLKRNAGPQSLQVSIPQSTSKPRSGGAQQPLGNGFPSASPNSATRRPGNSRSTTWTDSLPTTRALTLDQPTPPPNPHPPTSSNSQPLQPLQEQQQQQPSQPYYAPSPHTATPQPTYATPPIVVVPSVLNQPRGRFGLFRRASMSPKVEKGGFFGFVAGPGDVSGGGDKEKKRLKGLGLKKQKRLSVGGSGGAASGPPSSPNANEEWLSPPQPLFSPASQQQRFPSSSSSTGSSGFQRPSSPLSPYYTPPEPSSHRHTTYHPSSSSPVPSSSPTLYNQPPPSSPSRAPFSVLPPSSPRASQRIIAGGAGRPSLDFHPGRPHVAFPYHAPPSSSSLCSASADDEDDEEDFPFRDARPNKASKRKIRPKSQHSQRGRSCSPSRAGAGVGGDLEGAKVTRAWWKVASGGGGLAESPSHQSVQERANRGAGMLGSSAPTVRGSMEAAGGWGSRRGSTSTREEGGEASKVVERGFKVTSRPSSPASSFRRGLHPVGGGGSSLRPEGESGSGRSSLALGRIEGAGGVASTRELTNTSSPSTANSTTSHPSPVLTPRIPSNPVSRSNSLLASPGLPRPRIPSRSSSINRSWTPPTKSAPPPPSAPSSVPTTPHFATSFPNQQQPTLPLLPLGQPQPQSDELEHELELEDAPSPLFFAQSSRISPTLSNSSRSQENSSSSNGSNGASVGFTQNGGTDQETEPTDDGEELGTSCEGGERDGWEERRWSLNSEAVGGAEGKVRC